MAEPQHPTPSDLMDSELDADHAEAAIDALLQEPALAAEWHRMHQVRGLLRGEVAAPFDVSAAVRDALADAPAYLLPAIAPARPARRWPRYAVGGALAASVALLTVVGLRPWQSPAQAPQVATAPASAESAAEPAAELAAAGRDAQASSTPAGYPSRLDSYWAVHADSTLLAGPEALSPLVRNVRVDSRQ